MSSFNMRGAILMAGAMASFSVNDALTKLAIGEMNVAQVMMFRSGIAAVLLAAIAVRQGHARSLSRALRPIVALRVAGEVGGTLSYLAALASLPLANASAIFNALPIAVALGAAIVFRERIGWCGHLAVLIGFAGVLVIIRPGLSAFDAHALWALVAVAFCTVRDLATARISREIGTSVISALTTVSLALAGAVILFPLGGWVAMETQQVALLAGAAIAVVTGFLLLINALRSGATAMVSTFRYTYLFYAIILGIAVFGEAPDLATGIGIALIVVSGLLAARRRPAIVD